MKVMCVSEPWAHQMLLRPFPHSLGVWLPVLEAINSDEMLLGKQGSAVVGKQLSCKRELWEASCGDHSLAQELNCISGPGAGSLHGYSSHAHTRTSPCSWLPVLALQLSHPHGHAWLSHGFRMVTLPGPALLAISGCSGMELWGEVPAASCPSATALPALTPQCALAAVWQTCLVLSAYIVCADIVFPWFSDRYACLKAYTPWSLGAYHARMLNETILWSFLTVGQRKFLCRKVCSKGTK